MSEKELKGFAIAMPIETIATAEGTGVVVNVQTFVKDPKDEPELKRRTAEEVAKVFGAESHEGPHSVSNSGGNSFGFFNWGGCNWEPKGPQKQGEKQQEKTPPPSYSNPNSN